MGTKEGIRNIYCPVCGNDCIWYYEEGEYDKLNGKRLWREVPACEEKRSFTLFGYTWAWTTTCWSNHLDEYATKWSTEKQ